MSTDGEKKEGRKEDARKVQSLRTQGCVTREMQRELHGQNTHTHAHIQEEKRVNWCRS